MAKKTRNYLALDLGAESGRGIVGRFDGGKIRIKEVYRFGHTPLTYRGTWRWDVLAMVRHLKQALAAASEQTRGELISLAVDTWGVDYVLLDRNDDLLGYPYHYRDDRGNRAMAALLKKLPAEEIYNVTGIQFLFFNTIYQLYAEKMERTGALEAAKAMLFMPDFLAYALGGEKSCEYTIASTAQLLDARRRAWSRSLIKKAGLPGSIFLPLVQPGTIKGRLHKDVAAETGAPRGVNVVAPGAHDTASAVAAVPAEGEDWAFLSSGTWSLFGAEESQPVINETSFAHSFTNEGGLEGTTRLLRNIMGLWLVQELRRAWTDKRGNAPDYATLMQEAAQAKPFGPVVDESWGPFSKPGEMPAKFAHYCKKTGQTPPRTRGEFVRCALESLALAYRDTLESLQTVRGRRVERIHIVGGGTKNTLLNQMAADACGREVVAGPEEATALGNIMAQMLADGQIGSVAEGRGIVKASFRPGRYRPRDREAWDERYGFYQKLKRRRVSEKM